MDATNQQSYKNDHLEVLVKREPRCLVNLEISVSPKGAEAAYQKAVKEVTKEVSLPGFRKGKAPAHLVSDNFTRVIDNEFKDIALKTAFNETLNLIKLYPYDESKIRNLKVHEISRDKGCKISAGFYTFPSIPEILLKDLPVIDTPLQPVDEKKIEHIIEQTRMHFATWEPITDRAAQENDYVILSINTVEVPHREVCEDKTFKLTKGEMPEWIRQTVIGMNPEESKEATSVNENAKNECQGCDDPSHNHTEDHFRPTLCSITLKGITNPILPEITDEFATKVGCKDVEQFHQRTREVAETDNLKRQRAEKRNSMFDYLWENYSFEIPAPIVDNELDEYLKTSIEELSPEEKTDNAKEIIKREAAILGEHISKRAFIEFIAASLRNKYNIQVTQQDIQKDVLEECFKLNLFNDKENFKKYYETISQRVARDKLIEKTLDFLIDNAGKENP